MDLEVRPFNLWHLFAYYSHPFRQAKSIPMPMPAMKWEWAMVMDKVHWFKTSMSTLQQQFII